MDKKKQGKCKFSIDYEMLYTENNNFNIVNPMLVFHKADDLDCYFISFDTLERWGFPHEKAEMYSELPINFKCEGRRVCGLKFVKCVGGFKLMKNYTPYGYNKGLSKAQSRIEHRDKWCNMEWKVYADDVELATTVRNPLIGRESLTCYSSGNGIWHTTKTANRPNAAELTLKNGLLSMEGKEPMSGGSAIKVGNYNME
jgi:hypothetical protein